MTHETLLSVVVAARNDDHGRNMLQRMQIFVTGSLEQARRHRLPSELIIVEWNPPPGRPRLADALAWKDADGPCRVRIIEVPPAVHEKYPHADRLPLFQMIAKNVGVRRARGRFVLCTNIDLLFSDALIQLCASGHLDSRCLYRVDRLDVSADVPVGVPVVEQLEFCSRNVLRVNTRWGTFERGRLPAIVGLSRLRRRFEPGMRRRWHALRGLASRERLRRLVRTDTVRSLPARMARAAWHGGARLARRVRSGIMSLPGAWDRLSRQTLKPLHTNACGDFTLLAREQWWSLRGYPELPMFSLHLDSVFCQMAHHAGVREVLLRRRCRAYHLDHESGWSPQEHVRLLSRLEALSVPVVHRQLYDDWVSTMRRQRGAIIFNGEDWGLEKENLRETEPATGLKAECAQA